MPRVQHRQTHLAVVVEVRVEAHRVAAGRVQVDQHRRVRIVVRKVDVEEEAAVGVGRVGRRGDEHLHQVEPAQVDPHKDRAAEAQRQTGGQGDRLLGQPLHPRRVRALARRPHRRLEVVRDDKTRAAVRVFDDHLVRVELERLHGVQVQVVG